MAIPARISEGDEAFGCWSQRSKVLEKTLALFHPNFPKENRFAQLYGCWKLLGVWLVCWYSVLSSNLPIIITNKLLQHLVWLQALLLRLLRLLRLLSSASTIALRSWNWRLFGWCGIIKVPDESDSLKKWMDNTTAGLFKVSYFLAS